MGWWSKVVYLFHKIKFVHWLRISYPLGKIIAFFGILMSLPAIVSWLYQDSLAMYYLLYGGAVFTVGLIMIRFGRRYQDELYIRHGFLLIAVIWTILPFFAALPLMGLLPDLSFTKSYFEAASGLTASGATVISQLDDLAPSLNFWRGEMSWIGGMGLIVLATAILPILGVGGSSMFQAEIPGPIKENRMTPQIAQTAKSLWLIYTLLTLVCAIAYYLAGMSGLDAIIHAFTTLSLGGFSSHDASYAYFQSPLIEAVAIFFMVIAGMNFATHYTAWVAKSAKVYWLSLEWRVYLALVFSAVGIVTLFLWFEGVYDTGWAALRYGAFNVISIVTTTGYSNVDYALWPLFAPLLMLIMANFTACSGSTGGGLKLMRFIIARNQLNTECTKLVHPAAYYDNKVGSVALPQKTIISILFFILAYIGLIVLLTLFLVATGLDLLTALSAAIASVSNTGPGLGTVGPAANYGHLKDIQIWACSFAMLCGRLELMAFIVVLNVKFWRY